MKEVGARPALGWGAWVGRAAMLIAVAAVPYALAIGFPFQLDDYSLISHLDETLASAFHNEGVSEIEGSAAHLFRPVFWLSLLPDARSLSPAIGHGVSIGLFVLGVLVFWRLISCLGGERVGFWAAVTLALLASHRQAVTWIAARADVLAMLFGLLALLTLANRRVTVTRALFAGLMAALALGSKETGIWCLPWLCVLLWRGGGRGVALLLLTLPCAGFWAWSAACRGSLLPSYHGHLGIDLGAAIARVTSVDWLDVLRSMAPDLGLASTYADDAQGWHRIMAASGLIVLGIAVLLAIAGLQRGRRSSCFVWGVVGIAQIAWTVLPIVYVVGDDLGSSGRMFLLCNLGLAVVVGALAGQTSLRGVVRGALVVGLMAIMIPWAHLEVTSARQVSKAVATCRARSEENVKVVLLAARAFHNQQPMLAWTVAPATSPPFVGAGRPSAIWFKKPEYLLQSPLLQTTVQQIEVYGVGQDGGLVPAVPALRALTKREVTDARVRLSQVDALAWRLDEHVSARAFPYFEYRLSRAGEGVRLKCVVRGRDETVVDLGPAQVGKTMTVEWTRNGMGLLDPSVLEVLFGPMDERIDVVVESCAFVKNPPVLTGEEITWEEGELTLRGVPSGTYQLELRFMDLASTPAVMALWRTVGEINESGAMRMMFVSGTKPDEMKAMRQRLLEQGRTDALGEMYYRLTQSDGSHGVMGQTPWAEAEAIY